MDNGASSYRRFLSGDKEGLAEIVREYRDGLTLYIKSIVRDEAAAEELMEDTFVKLYVSKPRYSGKSSFKTWLYSIGRYTAVDYLRRSPKFTEIPEDALAEQSDGTSLEQSCIKSEERLVLHRAVRNLKAEYSQILYLVFFEGFTNSEAAAIMKRSDKQIRDLLYNAKKALKAELERTGFEYEEL